MRAYEIQTYQDGRWKIDSVFDDRELALFEARRVDAGNRYSGVRVVEETFDESSQNSLTRTIFRGGRAEKQAFKEDNKSGGAARPRGAAHGTGKDRAGANGGRSLAGKKKKKGFLGPLIILTFLVIFGLAGLYALQHVFKII